ncbi:MAG: sigma-70 family RNA polymerase sigma factor [Planctomycetota bacterium]
MAGDVEMLVQEASRGDAVAVESLLTRFLPGLRAFIRLRTGKLLRARESASDLVQSVCREVIEHLDRFQYRSEAGFKYWLYTEALRKIANRREYHEAAKRDVRKEHRPDQGAADQDLLASYQTLTTPSQHAIAHEELERIERAFDQLPETEREVILLSRIVGLSADEIAEQQGRSQGAVRTALSRALAKLAEHLDD